MRKLLFILLLFPAILKAQVKTKLYVSGPLATNVYRGPLGTDSALYIVSNCGNPNTIIPKANVGQFYSVYRGSLIYKDTCNNRIFTSNPDSSWSQLLGGDTTNIYISGDTTIVNNFIVKKALKIPLTDTTNAKKGCGNIIYDTINEHFYGDVCINGVHQAWQCFDCATSGGGIQSIDAANGLTARNDSTVILGGTLDQNTTVAGAAFDLTFSGLTSNKALGLLEENPPLGPTKTLSPKFVVHTMLVVAEAPESGPRDHIAA